MAQIIFDLEAIQDIKNKLESLIQRGQKMDSVNFRKLTEQKHVDLDEKEKVVFKFITDNPGKSKQDIVNALIKTISRGTVFRVITNLVRYQMVIERPDDRNRQKLRLYINRGSLILQVVKDIKNFKRSYLNLIKRANEEYKSRKKQDLTGDELVKSKRQDIDISEIYSWGIDEVLTKILKKLIMSYSLNAIFVWPEKIKDLESLNRLYLMVFQSLNEIFSEHVKYVPFDIEDKNERVKGFQDDLRYSYDDANMYVNMLREFDEYNLGTEFDSVMSDLFTASKMHMTWKDYRTGLNEYKSEYPL
jgi:hypothetical protein